MHSSKKDILIYTSILGKRERDRLINPTLLTPNADYVCFSDRTIDSRIWNVVAPQETDYKNPDTRRTSRFYKMQIHNIFPDYEYYMWVDCGVRLSGPTEEFIISNCEKADISVTKHPMRNCAYDEMQTVSELFNEKEICARLKKELEDDNYPKNNGLIAGNRFFYKKSEKVTKFMDAWWNGYQQGSCRDQVIANYWLYKLDVSVNYLSYDDLEKEGIKY